MTNKSGLGKKASSLPVGLSPAGRLSGSLYLNGIEPLMKSMKNRIARWISDLHLESGLDVCCGIGTQCSIISALCPAVSVRGIDLNLDSIRFAQRRQRSDIYMCGDALAMPVETSSVDFLIYSYALHDKPEAMRKVMMSEAERVLRRGGYLFILDFEQPERLIERTGYLFTTLVELMAGWEHYRNGREFIRRNGLSGFMERYRLRMVNYHRIPAGHTGIVMAVFKERDE